MDYVPVEIIALNVTVNVQRNDKTEIVTYWYKLPKHVPAGNFSEWQAPLTWETQGGRDSGKSPMFYILTNGGDLDTREIPASAPKIRASVVSRESHFDEGRFWRRVQQAVSKFIYDATNEESIRRHFVPQSQGAIPDC